MQHQQLAVCVGLVQDKPGADIDKPAALAPAPRVTQATEYTIVLELAEVCS